MARAHAQRLQPHFIESFFLAAFETRRDDRFSRPGLRGIAPSLAFFALALFSKEMAATLPALIFAERWLAGRGREGRLRSGWRACRPYLAVLGLCLVARQAVLGAPGPALFSLGAASYAATSAFVLARYAVLLLLPVGLDAHYAYAPLGGLAEPLFLVSAAILSLAAAGGLILYRRHPRAAFWALWVPVSLAPVLALGRFGDVLLADRFLYIPSAGLALLLPMLAVSDTVPAGKRWHEPFVTLLNVEFVDTGFNARWEYFHCGCGDILVRVEQSAPDGVLSGELLLVDGQAIAGRGMVALSADLEPMLQAPSIMMHLAFVLMERALPAGPASVSERVNSSSPWNR